jgi:hypothetical protein
VFLFEIEDKKSIPIEQLIDAPPHMNIKSYEPEHAKKIMTFLLSMPDRSTKQTLCVMPVDQATKPTSWDAIKDGKFWLINGQHNVKASYMMRDEGIDEKDLKDFASWNCFVVWTENNEKLRQISAYYNRVNHFGAIKPSWATNILGARQVWINLDRPKNPKELKDVGTAYQASRTKEAERNKAKFRVMFRSSRPKTLGSPSRRVDPSRLHVRSTRANTLDLCPASPTTMPSMCSSNICLFRSSRP